MPQSAERQLSGSQIVCESLTREGVEVVFGFPGGAILPLYDALGQHPAIRHILVRHEQGAVFAADGYARALRKVGVCLATSGPGATNLITGIAAAHLDSSPVVAITGQVASHLVGTDAFQEVDITGAVLPFTKRRYLVRKTPELAATIKEAFYLARTGRPGPVLLDIPTDIFKGTSEFDYPTEDPVIRGYVPRDMNKKDRIFTMEKQVDKAVKEIEQSGSPVIIAGRGIIISDACKELQELAEKIDAPVVSTLLGMSAFPQNHPLNMGMIGMHGMALANMVIREAKLVIAIGNRFDDRATATESGLSGFAPNAKIIHIDIDPAEIGKNVPIDIPIVGDAKKVLQSITAKVAEDKHYAWLSQIAKWRRKYPNNLVKESDELIPEHCIKSIYDITEGDLTVVTGVGQHQMWAAQYFTAKDRNAFISSGGLGQMGFGLPAGIGVQVARPDQTVWVIDGDGSFQMSMQELEVVRQEGLPLKIAIMNNGYLGMVRQWQEKLYNERYFATPLSGPDFVKIAEAYGIPALRVLRKEAVKPAIVQAMRHKGPFLLDFQVEQEGNVHPWVIPGVLSSKPNNSGETSQKEHIGPSRRVLVALVENKAGVLEEVTSLYRRRGFNLESVTVGPCEQPGLSRMTIAVETNGNGQRLEQARKQLEKLIPVRKVFDITDKSFISRETVLLEINAKSKGKREALAKQLETFGAKIVESNSRSVFIEVTGDMERVEGFTQHLQELNFKIAAQVRSGLIALQTEALG